MYFIGLGYDRETNISPSSQFQFKKSRKCKKLIRLLNEKVCKMKSILWMNILLMNSSVEDQEFSDEIDF